VTVELVRLGDISRQVRGVTYSKMEASVVDKKGYLPILRAGNISQQGLDYKDLVYVPLSRVSAIQRVRKGDVVIAASSGSIDVVGKAAAAVDDFPGGFGAFCKVLRPTADVDHRYFAHFFQTSSYRRRISALAAGANINNLRNEHLDDLLIPLPPVSEQRRVAEVLDRADALRTKRRQFRALFEDLTQSIFMDLFGPARDRRRWPIATLGELLAGIDSGKSPICLSRPALDVEWGVLKLGAVSRQHYLPDQNKALPGDVKPAVADEVKAGDLLMARKNTLDLVGACALVGSTRPRLLLPDLIFRLRLHDHAPVELRYLHRTLGQVDVRGQIRSLAGGSAGSMPNISKARLSTVRVLIPPLELQKAFGARMELVEQQETRQSWETDQLDALFASLQQRAFSGEL